MLRALVMWVAIAAGLLAFWVIVAYFAWRWIA